MMDGPGDAAADPHAAPVALWLPAAALGCYEGDARLRSWLAEPGLLTVRMRALAGERFHLRVIAETSSQAGHVRAIELRAGERVWLYAETRVPAATLVRHPWLAGLGGRALGEVLAARDDVLRRPFEFTRALPGAPLAHRALARAALPPQPLWVRRSGYAVGGAPFELHEVFFPGTGMLD